MIVAPAYIVSLKVSFLSFGQAEYVVQGILFIVFCILMKKFKGVYLFSFLTAIFYGAVLDLWRLIVPHFNPNITPSGSLPLYIRIIYFAIGMVLTSLSVALFFKTYFYPQVYDFFVKGVSAKYSLNRTKFKMCFDATFLLISIALTFILFKRLNGVGIGTIILTCCNGMLIGFFDKTLDKFFEFKPRFSNLAQKFAIE
jgi:uncharacterized membrane protein YczE